jgi:hypothetical protein
MGPARDGVRRFNKLEDPWGGKKRGMLKGAQVNVNSAPQREIDFNLRAT